MSCPNLEELQNESNPIGIALVGNPGAGKSTILNGLAGSAIFKSGLAIGAGLTTVLQKHECVTEGKSTLTLFDTPGLADIQRKTQAGEEIDKVLSEGLSIKIAFVVTLEKGRAKPDDAMTIRLVLEAIKSIDVNDMFGVILNQLSKPVMDKLEEEKENYAMLRKNLTGEFRTSHWIAVQVDPELTDKSNGMLMNDEVLKFFSLLPETKPPDAEVDKVDTSDMEEKIAEQQQRINQILAANEEQREEMVRQMELQKEEAKKREESLSEDLKELRLAAHQEREMEKYRKRKILTGIGNTVSLGTGAVASYVLLNPAPMIIAAAACRKARRPKDM